MTRRPVFSVCVYVWMTGLLYLQVLVAIVLLPWSLTRDRDRRTAARVGAWLTRSSIVLVRSWRLARRQLQAVDLSRPAVVVVNHRSMADIALMVALPTGPRLCAKPWVARLPGMGPAMRMSGHVVFDPSNLGEVRDALERLEGLARRGVSVLFFPEGTRRTGSGLGPFEDGAFRIAVRAGVDVLPVVLRGTAELLPPGGACFTDHQVRVTALARIPPGGDRNELKARVRAAMLSELRDEQS